METDKRPEGLEDLVRLFRGPFLEVVDRVMVFVDWAYVTRGSQVLSQGRTVDVVALSSKIAGRRRLLRTYVYDGRIDSPPDEAWKLRQQGQQRFESALARAPSIELRWGRLQWSESGRPRQKGVDVLLSLDMLRFALKNNYDRAILISGDGDYADIVKMVKDEGKIVEVAMFPASTAQALTQAADVLVELDAELMNGCWLPRQSSTTDS